MAIIQTSLKYTNKLETKNTSFFDRLMQLIDYKGINSVNKLAIEYLGYSSAEKINRLKKKGAKPSYDIVSDISNKFEDIDTRWLITGVGSMIVDKGKLNVTAQINPDLVKLYDLIDQLSGGAETKNALRDQVQALISKVDRMEEKLHSVKKLLG